MINFERSKGFTVDKTQKILFTGEPSMSETAPRGERINIGLFGRSNVGKSSLLNALCGQQVSIVDERSGTTTDAVSKIYELIPIGPVTFFDTAGLDDKGVLGEKRIDATKKILRKVDIAVVVTDETGIGKLETALIADLKRMSVPFVAVFNKSDKMAMTAAGFDFPSVSVSAKEGRNIDALKAALTDLVPDHVKNAPALIRDLLSPSDTVVCVTPIDTSAPKGRLILPQVQVIRDVLDARAFAYVVQDQNDCLKALENMKTAPKLVVTDSQLVKQVAAALPSEVPLTTFSTLFARYKGDIDILYAGASVLKTLKKGDRVLIAEACSHHVQDDDIARVKMPALIRKNICDGVDFSWSAGIDFPDDLSEYSLVIHCGGCMLSRLETLRRLNECVRAGVPVTNFGIAISAVQGVLNRIVAPLGIK